MLTDFRPKIIVISAISCSLLLFAIYYGYIKLAIDNPLQERLVNYAQVESVELNGQEKIIQITLKDKKNLPLIYDHLQNEIQSTAYGLEITDNPSDKLINFYYRSQFIIQETLQRGNYMEMLDLLETMAQQADIDAIFYLDESNLYMDLEEGSYSLVRIITHNRDVRLE